MLITAHSDKLELSVANLTDLKFTSAMKKTVTDEQLMLLYAKGDILAFEQLYAKHKGGLFRYCLRQIGNRAKAEECFQEIWLKLINSRVNYQPKALFTTYLYRIAQNNIIDLFRKEKKLKLEMELDDSINYAALHNDEADLVEGIIEQHEYQLLRQQIESLPQEQKTVVLLKLDAGLSLEEISNILDCGRETIKSRLRYAMNKLRCPLGESQ